MKPFGLLVLLALASPALAGAPEASLRPVPRAEAEATGSSLRPAARSGAPAALPDSVPSGTELRYSLDEDESGPRDIARASAQAVRETLRPLRRTRSLVQKAMARQAERRRGALCGDIAIQGDAVGEVLGRLDACGISDAVKVRSVSGIKLSRAALMDCTTAKALKSWVDDGLAPAVGDTGGGLAQLRIAGAYSCRTRNSQPGAKISEHGKGRAVDISAIRLRDGTAMTVSRDYRSEAHGEIMQRAYRAACGIFGTTLGPDADRFHQDHFHFDTARYRSGSYCR